MEMTFTLNEEEYNQLIQMLVNANPLIRKIATQAQAQMVAAASKPPKPAKPNGLEADKR